MIRIGHRFMSGQPCTATGNYEFDGYSDASSQPLLSNDEKRIIVNAGKPFPTASAENKTAYWIFTGFN